MSPARATRRAVFVIAAALALGACDFSGGSRRDAADPVYPLDVVGSAREVESCESFGLVEDASVTLHLVGRRLAAEATADLTCEVVLTGDGTSDLGDAPGPSYLFGLTIDGDCLELPTDPLGDLGAVRFATTPLLTFGCLGTRLDGAPLIRCVVDERCRFRIADFEVRPGFDVPAVVAEVVARAIDNLIDF